MGSCCSSSEDQSPEAIERKRKEVLRTRELEQQLTTAQQQDKAISKLLLLGAGESGKSTLFKQMITIYGKGFPDQERMTYVPIIANNIITSMKTLCRYYLQYGPVSANLTKQRDWVENDLKNDEDLTPEVGAVISALWNDPGIRRTYEHRASYQLTDSADYFFNRLKDVCQQHYLPTQQDVLRSRVRTTGIVENEFEIESNKFKMFDVGGQRNERKKWIHCFEKVTAVLFVVAISEYDQMLYEDERTNRMTEALSLFDEICNSRWFSSTAMILFLNKRDLFQAKLAKVPLTVWLHDYTGPNTYDACVAFLTQLFTDKNKAKKQIYTHVTCATDTDNIAAVFNAVKDIIIRQSLNEAGLLE
jgi:GTPase SAR1 family protein